MHNRGKIDTFFIITLFVLSIVLTEHAVCATVNATSCSRAAVQEAIDSASDGDTVNVPAGNCTWTSAVTIPDNKKLDIIGAGIDNTVITLSNVNHAFTQHSENKPFRISGFTFTGTITDSVIYLWGTCNGFRVDHNKFSNITGGRGVRVDAFHALMGPIYGVIDHNIFTGSTQFPCVGHSGHNDQSWSEPLSLGSANAVFVEDNIFDFSSAPRNESVAVVDCNMGGRFVFRHNTLAQIFIATHDACSNPEGHRGCYSWEFYGNNITMGHDGGGWYRIYNIRGGSGVIHDETLTALNGAIITMPIGIMNYRSCVGDGTTCNPYWDRCDGDSVHDGNLDSTGWPCLDQIGRTSDMNADGLQDSAPVYEWNNTLNGSDVDYQIHNPGGCDNPSVFDHIKENREFYNDTARPGYTPYTYPHPLALEPDNPPGPPPPPENLAITN